MLINIVKQLFQEFRYLHKDFNMQNYQVSLFYKEEIDNYFIVLDKDNISSSDIESLDNTLNVLFNIIKNDEASNEAFDKNTTVIMCLNGEIDTDLINNLEENPYIFKKNIITYSSEILESLNELLSSNYSYENLISTLNDENKFEQYKRTSEEGYKLLLTLFIKLSFLRFYRQTRELGDLLEIIETKVTEVSLSEVYNIVNAETFNIQNINSYEDLISVNLIQGNANE